MMLRMTPTVRRCTAMLSRSMATLPPPRLFDYETITSNLKEAQAIEAVETAFGKLAQGEVDVPIPMHIGVNETATAGPGDCHIKGGYVSGETTFTVKLATVSFYKNIEKGLPPGSGMFVVCDAVNGGPLAIFQENRYMTDLRTGAAGAVAVKHCVDRASDKVAFIGGGVINEAMARACTAVHTFNQGFVYGLDEAQSLEFAKNVDNDCGYPVKVCASVEEALAEADVVFTATPASSPILELGMLQPHATIIASGSDQPSKQEMPVELMKHSKMVCDLVRQCALVGELRSAIEAGEMTADDVHAEIGEIVNGTKPGREGDEMILVDLTGTGAQDAAIGQVAWDVLSKL